MVINLIEPITTSYGVKFTSFFVFLIGCSSSIGRISSAHLLETISFYSSPSPSSGRSSSTVPNPCHPEHLMGYSCLSVALLNLLYALYIPSPTFLALLLTATGYLYGMMGVLSASSAVSMFGIAHVATNDGVYDLSGAVGAYLIAYGVVAVVTSSSHLEEDDDPDHCLGAKCYQTCFLCTSGLCFVGFVLSLFIHRNPNQKRTAYTVEMS
jgi:hypothetical protein